MKSIMISALAKYLQDDYI